MISRGGHNLISIHRQCAKGILIVFYAEEHRNKRELFLQIVESHSNTKNDELSQFSTRVEIVFVSHRVSDKHNVGDMYVECQVGCLEWARTSSPFEEKRR